MALSTTATGEMLCGDRKLSRQHPHVMGIVNVTPDSFSDGGELVDSSGLDLDRALERVAAMCDAGATIIDVGGESTRPGAQSVSAGEEAERVLPLVEAVRREFDVVISVDTSNPDLIRESARAGAGIINDVRALKRPGALEAAAGTGLPVCLMHMQGEPGTMQQDPSYDDVLGDISTYLSARVSACTAAGIDSTRIILDPGFGFGKTVMHNLELLARLEDLEALGLPLLIGLSRKRMIGLITGHDGPGERMAGSVAAAVIALQKGAWIIRAHDVPETVDALRICEAVRESGRELSVR